MKLEPVDISVAGSGVDFADLPAGFTVRRYNHQAHSGKAKIAVRYDS